MNHPLLRIVMTQFALSENWDNMIDSEQVPGGMIMPILAIKNGFVKKNQEEKRTDLEIWQKLDARRFFVEY